METPTQRTQGHIRAGKDKRYKNMKQNKYRLEKVLHELIRDLPEVATINTKFEKGFICIDECFYLIDRAINKERNAGNENF